MTIITGPDNIRFAQLLARRAALRLEAKGLRRSGRPMSVVIREAYPTPAIRATHNKAQLLILVSALVDLGVAAFNAQFPSDGVYNPPPPLPLDPPSS